MDNKYNKNTTQDGELYAQYSSGVQAFMKAGHWVFLALVGLIFAMLVYFFTLGGYFAVSPQEAVIVLRFGKYEKTYTSDWHWFLPDPVTSKVVVPTSPQTLQVTFNAGIPLEQLPPPGPNGELPGMQPSRDRYLLTADANIIHASWSARFQVSDPARFYQTLRVPVDPAGPDEVIVENGQELGRRGPRVMLGRMLESAVIITTAAWTVDDILYSRQTEYRDAVERCYRKMVADLDIGIVIEEVRINGKVMTPAVTQGFFDALTAVRSEQGTMIEKAAEYRDSTLARAKEESARIVAAAENYRTMTVADVKAESLYFESFLKEYTANPRTALMSRYNAVLGEVLSNIDQKFVLGAANGGKVWLKLSPEIPKPQSADNGGNASAQSAAPEANQTQAGGK
ncbi:MAG: hypothetical protein E7056_03475 [Lentisphaerae bacterium]|nr:hypothetical protein [Lentisphaerota bacterium]